MNNNFNNKFDVQNSRFDNNDIKFNEIKCKFDTKFEEQSRQFDELKIDINEVKIKCESECNELKRDIEKVVKSVGEQIKSKAKQIINNQVSDECKTNENYNDMCKNVVLENKEINVESDKEDFVEVEFSNEVLLANADERV